ncbi:MAG: dienelactone hydrolase family protein [Anaerolineales bacterium]
MRKFFCLLALIFLAACQPADVKATPSPTAVPSVTSTPSPAPTLTPSPTPTAAQLIYPYTIDGLRQHQYQSGKITVTSTLPPTDVATRYLISYPSDGLTITGVMQIPINGHAPFPVIIMNHGYFDREGYVPGDGTYRAADYLNKYGYLTLSSDYRSWGKSDIGPSFFYSGLAIDVINLMNAVPSIPQADPNRIGMWGHSMGGGVTAKVLVIDPRVKAAVFYSTVSADDADLISLWGTGCIGDIHAGEISTDCNSSDIVPLSLSSDLITAYRTASSDSNLLHQISPIYHLDLITAPVEISYGTKDSPAIGGALPEWSQKLYQAFKAANKNAQLFAYDGEYHSFNGDAWLAFMDRTTQFFDQYVKNATQ